MGAGNWPQILKPRHNIYIYSDKIFDNCDSFCVMWLWTWQKRQLWIVDRQFCAGLIYYSISIVVAVIFIAFLFLILAEEQEDFG